MSGLTPRDDPNYRHTDPNEELWGDYVLECTECGMQQNVHMYAATNMVVGRMIGTDPQDPSYGRCLKCKSSGTMRIIKTPVPPSVSGVPGFTKIPTE
jgi:hypothetical protein